MQTALIRVTWNVLHITVGDDGAGNGGVVPNIRRRRRREVCGMDYNLSNEEKVAVVDTHNTLRSLEGASDMLKVVSIRTHSTEGTGKLN